MSKEKKIKFPEEIIGEYLYDLGVGRHFNLVTNSTVEKKMLNRATLTLRSSVYHWENE